MIIIISHDDVEHEDSIIIMGSILRTISVMVRNATNAIVAIASTRASTANKSCARNKSLLIVFTGKRHARSRRRLYLWSRSRITKEPRQWSDIGSIVIFFLLESKFAGFVFHQAGHFVSQNPGIVSRSLRGELISRTIEQ